MQKEATAQVVNTLFERLISINPAFKQAWPTEYEFQATKKEWVLAFMDAGISSIERVKKGIDKVRLSPSPFIPSPGEFIEFCKVTPEDIGAPSLEKAYREACEKSHPCYGENKNWSHKAIKHACLKIGSFFLRTESTAKTKPAFKEAYLEACEEFAEGRNLNQIEDKGQDTHENRMKYQEYFGELNQKRKYSNAPSEIEILSYGEWLSMGSN